MSDAPASWPVPTNHMSAPGWAQVSVPVPLAVDCSASKPAASWPVALICVPPNSAACGAGNAVRTSGVVTVVAASWLARWLAGLLTADGIALKVAFPVAAADLTLDGTETSAMFARPAPAPGGGQDLVTAVTPTVCTALFPALTADWPGFVPHATAYTTTSSATITPNRPNRRRVMTPRFHGACAPAWPA